MRLIACLYDGKITSGRADKSCCSNACSVKLNYARKHSFQTPYEKYLKSINEIKIANTENIVKPNSDSGDENNSSFYLLHEAQKRLTEINKLTTK